jgi:alkanesulfonate monooxygenase SsuD/methylene tetrahydromethanopterin reductase-like flavin-dependent oxidoreductase (luciferase family)
MKFGVFDHLDDAGVPLAKLYADRLKLVEAYDRAGIHGYHLAEHHGTPLGCAPSPALFLAAVAQRTDSLRFGPLVYLLPFYHPLRLIEEICMLDQLSGGRFQLGVGRGVSPFETQCYGLDFSKTAEIYHEAFELIRKGSQFGRADIRRKTLSVSQCADDYASAAAPASSTMVRDHAAGERGLAGDQ